MIRGPNESAAHRPDRPDALRLHHAAELGGGDGVRRAQGRGAAATAARTVPGRPQRPPATDRRRHQVDVQGGAAAESGRRVPVCAGADHFRHLRLCRLRRRPIWGGHHAFRVAAGLDASAGGRGQRRGARRVRDCLDERVRHRAGRMELEQQVLAARRLARVGADDQLRALVWSGAGQRPPHRQLAVAAGPGERPGGHLVRRHPSVVPVPSARRLRHLSDFRDCRNEPRAIRFSGGRAGARRRLPHRIQQHELRDVLPRGVHQHGHGVGRGDQSVPRRVAWTVSPRIARMDLVPAQGERDSVFLRVDALDAASLSLRLADGVRVEGVAAGGGRQSAGDCGRRPVFRLMTLFYVFAIVAILASLLVIGQRNPIYSVLLLIASFGALSGLYVLLDAPFVAVIQIVVYAGAIMVLFLFVVMLLNAPHEDTEYDERVHPLLRPGPMRFGAALAVGLLVELVWALTRGTDAGAFPAASVSSVAAIGQSLFTDYAFAFEVTSILILVAMVGAVVLARREGPR